MGKIFYSEKNSLYTTPFAHLIKGRTPAVSQSGVLFYFSLNCASSLCDDDGKDANHYIESFEEIMKKAIYFLFIETNIPRRNQMF